MQARDTAARPAVRARAAARLLRPLCNRRSTTFRRRRHPLIHSAKVVISEMNVSMEDDAAYACASCGFATSESRFSSCELRFLSDVTPLSARTIVSAERSGVSLGRNRNWTILFLYMFMASNYRSIGSREHSQFALFICHHHHQPGIDFSIKLHTTPQSSVTLSIAPILYAHSTARRPLLRPHAISLTAVSRSSRYCEKHRAFLHITSYWRGGSSIG